MFPWEQLQSAYPSSRASPFWGFETGVCVCVCMCVRALAKITRAKLTAESRLTHLSVGLIGGVLAMS